MLADGTNNYTYDIANRLKSVTKDGNLTQFAYNGLGNRLQQTIPQGSLRALNGAATTYQLDLNSPLPQILSDGTKTYLYGNGRIGEYGTSGWAYHHADGLGSVRLLTNSAGNVTGSASSAIRRSDGNHGGYVERIRLCRRTDGCDGLAIPASTILCAGDGTVFDCRPDPWGTVDPFAGRQAVPYSSHHSPLTSHHSPLRSMPMSTTPPTHPTNPHHPFIRQAIALARSAMQNGNHPFGALLVKDGKVLLRAENTVKTEQDCTRHAELNLVSRASQEFERTILADCILYTSTEPCAMCAGAIYWAGIRTVVYSCSVECLASIVGENLGMPCREVFARGNHDVEVIGPILAEEGAEAHQGFW